MDNKDDSTDYAGRVAELKSRHMLSANFSQPAEAAIQKGTLAVALCRALNIPARYFSGYAYQLEPSDFHDCFECIIGGSWVVFDATRLSHLNGLVRIGAGRDAADASVASIFGSASCSRIKVDCTLGEGQKFVPVSRKHLKRQGVALAPSA